MHPTASVGVQGVSFTYDGRSEPTLRDISFDLHPATLTVLVGPTGCGKTTLCSLLNGAVPHVYAGAFSGQALVDGLDTRQTPIKDLARHVGYVFQDTELMFCNLYVEDEVAFGPENLCVPRDEIRSAVDEALTYAGLTGLERQVVWQLSGGQIQKLGLAAVLATAPAILILDEPTANLDPLAAAQLYRTVYRLRDEGRTILLVSKELEEDALAADQLLVLDDGALRFQGTPIDIIRQHGDVLLDELGVGLPAATEVALRLMEPGSGGQRLALSASEAVELVAHQIQATAGVYRPTSQEVTDRAEASPVISARDVRFHYRGGSAGVRHASFDIPRGTFTAIVGQNGAGKSTLAKLMVGLIKPEAGELIIGGSSVSRTRATELASIVGLVLQNPEHQFLTDSVTSEVAYTLRAHAIEDDAEISRRVRGILELLELDDVSTEHPFALSAGKKRRLGVATMLAADPQVLVVDEPTYGQDRGMTQSLMGLMDQMRQRGVTIVMITHDMRLVLEYAEHVIVMARGETLYEGSPGILFQQPEVLQAASLRQPGLAEIVSLLRQRGVQLDCEVRRAQDLVGACMVPA